MLKELNGEMTAAKAGLEAATADTTSFKDAFDTAAGVEEQATTDRKAAWTEAGFDPNDKSFDEAPPAKDQGNDGPMAQGGNPDGSDSSNAQGGANCNADEAKVEPVDGSN